MPHLRLVAEVTRPMCRMLACPPNSPHVQDLHAQPRNHGRTPHTRPAPETMGGSTQQCSQYPTRQDRAVLHTLSHQDSQCKTQLSELWSLVARLCTNSSWPVATLGMPYLSSQKVRRFSAPDPAAAAQPPQTSRPEPMEQEVGMDPERPLLNVPLASLKSEIGRLEKHLLDMPASASRSNSTLLRPRKSSKLADQKEQRWIRPLRASDKPRKPRPWQRPTFKKPGRRCRVPSWPSSKRRRPRHWLPRRSSA